MNKLTKFLKNKNTVTILGVLACIVILWAAYSMRINQKTALIDVYYAKETIQPKTLITDEMVAKMSVPQSFIKGNYYKSYDQIVGKYSNYNSVIASGSIFYTDLLVEESSLPDAMLYDANEGERITYLDVTTESTYGNSLMPSDLVDLYVKLIDDDGKVVYGKFYEKIEILAVKDSAGRNVFESTEEDRVPAYVYFSLPEAKYLLFNTLKYERDYLTYYDIEIVLVPNTVEYEEEDILATEVSSEYLYDFVVDKLSMIDDEKDTYNDLINEMKQLELERQQKEEENEDEE